MSDNKSHVVIKNGSEKGFGIVFAIFFTLIGLWPLVNSEPVYIWALLIAATLIVIAYTAPNILATPNKWWFGFGLFLGGIIGPLFTLLVYVLTVLPIAIIMKILRKDLLNEKLDKSASSYWIERKDPVGSMKNQF